jgi:uncharacterized protein (TIGR00255 family)
MTGFGRAEIQSGERRVTAEIRSVNHRFFDFSARLPNSLSALEGRIRERVRQTTTRGKVYVTCILEGDADPHIALRVNEQLAQRYLQIAREIKTTYGLRGDLALESFLSLPEILTRESEHLDEEAAWSLVEEPLDKALEAFEAMRMREGEAMARDMQQRIDGIRRTLGRIEQCTPKMVEHVRERLRDRITQISQDTEYNQHRLEVELTLFADRTDVTEECVRLRSHLEQFEDSAGCPEPAGRRFNFLLQEMNREINTIGSKSQDLGISRDVISAKEEVEKIREQIQNIE